MNTSAVFEQYAYMFARRVLLFLACVVSTGVLLSLSSMSSYANQSQSYTIDYALGDNDSHASAREIALHKVRLLAIQKAGKYVQGDERLNQGQLSQNIRILGATVVSISDIKETYSIGEHNQSTLHLKATAVVDDAQLKKRIIAIQGDADQRSRLAQYESDLESIISRFQTLAEKKADNKQDIDAIIAERNALILNLHATLKAANLEFSQGFIFQQGNNLNDHINAKVKRIKDEVYQNIMENTSVHLQTVSVILNKDTGLYKYKLEVVWKLAHFPSDTYKKIIHKHQFLSHNDYTDMQIGILQSFHCGDCGMKDDALTYPYNGIAIGSFYTKYSDDYETALFNPYPNDYERVAFINPQQHFDQSIEIMKRLGRSSVYVDVFLKGIETKHVLLPVSHASHRSSNNYIIFGSGSRVVTFNLTPSEAKFATGVGAKLTIINGEDR